MIVSVFLVLVLLLLAVGVVATAIAAWRKAKYAPEIAIVIVSIALLFWLFLGANLPQSMTFLKWSMGRSEFVWSFLVDAVTWRTTLFLLILSTAVLLVTRLQLKPGRPEAKSSPIHWLMLPSLLLLVLTGLLAIWANSLVGLASSWSILILSWFVFLWIAGRPIIQGRKVLINGGTLFLGVGFLWLVEATMPGILPSDTNLENLSEPAVIWASMAGMVFLGAIPFQWWRSSEQWSNLSTSRLAVFHLVPSIVGASLLARIASIEITNTGYLLLVTGFGLIGYLIGISASWIHLGTPRKSLSGLLLAEAGMVAMVGIWADPPAVVAQVGVLTLALGALYLVAEKPGWRLNWPIFLPVAAIAGLPLTVGFLGLTGLYGNWLDQGLIPLMLVTVLLSVPLIALAILAWRSEEQATNPVPEDRFQPFLSTGGMVLLSLGLLALPRISPPNNNSLVWLLLLFAGLGGIALAWYVGRGHLMQMDFQEVFRIDIPSSRARKLTEEMVAAVSLVIREAITILEGEGGMLWVLVLVIVMWLARRG